MNSMVKNIFSTFSLSAGFKLIFAALFCVAVLCGCGSGDSVNNDLKLKDKDTGNNIIPKGDLNGNDNHPISGKQDGLNAETVWQIRQDLAQGYQGDQSNIAYHYISGYYGTYNGYVVIRAANSLFAYAALPWDMILGETLLGDGSLRGELLAWKEGQFYALSNAYNQGLLTNEDLREIAYYLYGDHAEEMNLEYHAGLRMTVRSAIRDSYFYEYLEPYFPQAHLSDVIIEKYYGSYEYVYDDFGDTYNDCVAVMINSDYNEYYDDAWEETVAGTVFRYGNGNRILLWKSEDYIEWQDSKYKGHFYELQEAYDLGFLTEDDIKSIAYYHETGKTISY